MMTASEQCQKGGGLGMARIGMEVGPRSMTGAVSTPLGSKRQDRADDLSRVDCCWLCSCAEERECQEKDLLKFFQT